MGLRVRESKKPNGMAGSWRRPGDRSTWARIACVLLLAVGALDWPSPALSASHVMAFASPAAPAAREQRFSDRATYRVCFVPDGPSCERLLIDAIGATRRELLIQAYSFTSAPIAEAVVQAHRRGVVVKVILDKSQATERYTAATFLARAGVPVVIDGRPAIAHNKVMILDGEAVFTGSFNFTRSAQDRNTENGILIRGDSALTGAYSRNWRTRLGESVPY